MTNPKDESKALTLRERLKVMGQSVFHEHDDPASTTPEVWRDINEAVALDLLSQLSEAQGKVREMEESRLLYGSEQFALGRLDGQVDERAVQAMQAGKRLCQDCKGVMVWRQLREDEPRPDVHPHGVFGTYECASCLAQQLASARAALERAEAERDQWMSQAVHINDGFEPRILESGDRRYRVLASPEAWSFMQAERDTANGALLVMKEALQVYANKDTYDIYGIPRIEHKGHHGCTVPDGGMTAREALSLTAASAQAAVERIRSDERGKWIGDDRAGFEKWMLETKKCVVGSTDPYPAGIEQEMWQCWKAARAILNRAEGEKG